MPWIERLDRSMRTCSVPGCENDLGPRGLCKLHYSRVKARLRVRKIRIGHEDLYGEELVNFAEHIFLGGSPKPKTAISVTTRHGTWWRYPGGHYAAYNTVRTNAD